MWNESKDKPSAIIILNSEWNLKSEIKRRQFSQKRPRRNLLVTLQFIDEMIILTWVSISVLWSLFCCCNKAAEAAKRDCNTELLKMHFHVCKQKIRRTTGGKKWSNQLIFLLFTCKNVDCYSFLLFQNFDREPQVYKALVFSDTIRMGGESPSAHNNIPAAKELRPRTHIDYRKCHPAFCL